MAGNNVKERMGPRVAPEALAAQQRRVQQAMTPPQQQQAPQQQVLFDIDMIEQLAEICKHYNLTQINIGNIAVINTRLEHVTPAAPAKKVTDEEILHNPYAGMEQ